MLFQRRDNPVLYSGFFKRVDCRFEPGDALFALVGVYLDQGLQRVDAGIPVAGGAGGAGGAEFIGVEAFGGESGFFGPLGLDWTGHQLVLGAQASNHPSFTYPNQSDGNGCRNG